MREDVVIVSGARTAMAEYAGTPGFGRLRDVSAIDLAAAAARAALERGGVSAGEIDHVVFGNVLQTSSDAIYGARHVGLRAGVPVEVPALTVNRLCGSGLEAITTACRMILAGEARAVLAGGMENMSQAPHVIRGLRGSAARLGRPPGIEDSLFAALRDSSCGLFMAETAERLAEQYGISREEQDAFALESHLRGAEAVRLGRFAEEIVPVTVSRGGKTITVDRDDHIKPDTSAAALAGLAPAFGEGGTVTAGNASGIVDCGAAVVVATAARARERGWGIRGHVRGWQTAGVPPEIMGIGPVPAIRGLLEKMGLTIAGIDLFEINEAFAAQYLAVERELGLDRDRVNVNGGAIALGHPLGATGTRLALALLGELGRRKARRAIAAACIGGGQGIAVLFERDEDI